MGTPCPYSYFIPHRLFPDGGALAARMAAFLLSIPSADIINLGLHIVLSLQPRRESAIVECGGSLLFAFVESCLLFNQDRE